MLAENGMLLFARLIGRPLGQCAVSPARTQALASIRGFAAVPQEESSDETFTVDVHDFKASTLGLLLVGPAR